MENYTELAAVAKKGDVEAFARLYEMVYKDLYYFALYLLKNTEDAKDAVGETVLAAFEGIHNLRMDGAFRGWIFKILTNQCKKRLKAYGEGTEELTEELLETVSVKATDISSADAAVVRSVFFELPPEDRMMIGMHLFAGYTSREIAQLTGKNENTVRSKERRALKKLAAMMDQ